MPQNLLPTSTRRFLSPARLADRPREASRPHPAARPREGTLARRAGIAGTGAGRCDAARHPRSGTSRTRHHDRRRDAARKLSNRFATALEGVDIDNPGTVIDRSGHPNPVPRIIGKIRRKHPVEVRDVEFLRANTDRKIKITVPGPFTMSQQAQNEYYTDEEDMALDYAAAVNEEIKDLFAAGADIVQIDEPWMQAHPEKAREYGVAALKRALEGVTGTTAVHICFGYAAMVTGGRPAIRSCPSSPTRRCSRSRSKLRNPSSIARCWRSCRARRSSSACSISRQNVETPETVAARIRRALPMCPPTG